MSELEYAQKRMQQKWFDLAMAEQRGAALPVLERMYSAYVLAMEEFNRRCEECQGEMQVDSDPKTVQAKRSVGSKGIPMVKDGGQNRKAS
ncbi:MAG: hypothetical protein NVSMB27_31900 [Ktedonobacteraceae bacterium]